jgi:hypothetical protein
MYNSDGMDRRILTEKSELLTSIIPTAHHQLKPLNERIEYADRIWSRTRRVF